MSDIAISSKDQLSAASHGDHSGHNSETTPPSSDSLSQNHSDRNEAEDEGVEAPNENKRGEALPLSDEVAPPLPTEEVPSLPGEGPPLPPELPPVEDDGWEPKWDDRAQAYYFFNRLTNVSQWENPRVLEASQPLSATLSSYASMGSAQPVAKPVAGGYDPSIHGDYDPNADYAQVHDVKDQAVPDYAPGADPAAAYAATGAFNRFTGKWQNAALNAENFNDENKSKRQMNAFFDVDAAANSHDGKSLKAERAAKKLSKQELKAFKEKRREKKEEKRRAWLRD